MQSPIVSLVFSKPSTPLYSLEVVTICSCKRGNRHCNHHSYCERKSNDARKAAISLQLSSSMTFLFSCKKRTISTTRCVYKSEMPVSKLFKKSSLLIALNVLMQTLMYDVVPSVFPSEMARSLLPVYTMYLFCDAYINMYG